jgi:predicted PurR-regulated permease PerM
MTARWRRIAFPILALGAVLLLASTLSSVINPVLIAVLLAVILNPVVQAASRFRLPRVVTVGVLYVLLALVVGLLSTVLSGQFQELARALSGEPFHADYNDSGLIELAGQPVPHTDTVAERDEVDDLNGNGIHDPGALLRLENWLNTQIGRAESGVLGPMFDSVRSELVGTVGNLARPASEMIREGLEQIAVWAGGLWHALTLLVLIPFYLFFFLVEYPSMSARLRELVPPRYREQVDRITKDIGIELVSFLRGRLMCGLIKAVFLWAGMTALGIQFALAIALVSGVLSLVPFVGFVVGVLPASVIALTMPGGGTEAFLWVAGLFIAGEIIEAAVLYPLVLGKETGLHPVTIVVVLLAGGALMGTLGVIVAIPLALICKVLWRELGLPLYRVWADPPADEPSTADEKKLILPAAREAEGDAPAPGAASD